MRRLFTAAPLLLLAACGKEPERKPAPGNAAAIHAQTVAVANAAWPSTYEATGTVKARASVVISSRVMAYARTVNTQIGDRVREGQVLVTLDSRDLDSATQRAEASREEIRSGLPEADSGIAAAKASVDLAQVTFNRMQDLFNKKSVSAQEFDESSARLKSAQAAYEMARARRIQLDAKMAQAEQQVRTAEIDRGYAQVLAPFSGIITAKQVEPGTLTVPGAPLFSIERDGAYRLEASVDELRLPSIRVGQSATVTLDGVNRPFSARVTEIVPSIDSAARTGTVKIDLPALASLRSGLFGRAAFSTGTREAITIPAAAVIERGQLQSVFVAEDGRAHVRLVTLGGKAGERVEVLSGLNGGDRVIAPVPQDLADGAPVELRP